jgi:hypothetical protein
MLSSVFKTLIFSTASGSNQLAKSRGYFSARILQTLSKLTIYTLIHNFLIYGTGKPRPVEVKLQQFPVL